MKKAVVFLMVGMMLFLCGCSANVLKGEVEAEIVAQRSEVAGKVLEVPVALGQNVLAGDVLAVIDDTEARYAHEQMAQVLVKKQAVVDRLSKGVDGESIRQGQNNITIAEQSYDNALLAKARAQEAFDRQSVLFDRGAIAKEALDQAQDQLTAADNGVIVAAAQLDNAKQQLSLLVGSQSTEEELRGAIAEVAQTQSQLSQLSERLEKYRIRAAADGIVASLTVQVGDMAAIGSAIADVSLMSKRYAVAYLPVKYLEQVDFGMEVTVQQKERQEVGSIGYLDIRRQYTPKDQQNGANRNEESIKMKILLPEDSAFKPGEQVEVLLPF